MLSLCHRAGGREEVPSHPPSSGLPADTLQGHRDRFHEQFHRYDPGTEDALGPREPGLPGWAGSPVTSPHLPRSLRNFFRRASDMLYFKRLIQIPRLPEVPSSPWLQPCSLSGHLEDPGYLGGGGYCALGTTEGGFLQMPQAAPAHGPPKSPRDLPTSCGPRHWPNTSSRWW